MDKNFFENYYGKINQVLMDDFVSFWEEKSVDKIYGGYLCGFDRDGELFYEDKSVWQQGRSLWMFSKLYNEFGKKQIWLDAAKSGYDFINKYCFAEDMHMYFRVTRDGKPLVLRRYYFSEAFAVMGYAEYYKATGDEEVKKRARQAAKKGKPFIFHWRGGYLTKDTLKELLDALSEAAAEKEKYLRVSLNWPQAVLHAEFSEIIPEQAVVMEEANEGEQL